MKKRILLVEPNFPYPNKSKNKANQTHKNFAPIGLLKLGAYHKYLGDQVKLVRGNKNMEDLEFFEPEEILITSLFTYWSKYVWDTIEYYRSLFPKAGIKLGGIYATLHHQTPEFIKKAKKYKIVVYSGIHKEAEKFLPDYSLLEEGIEHHIAHAMRGCIRRCTFCGTWRIEPELRHKTAEQVITELKKAGKNKVIFFDNNFFANPNIKEILRALEGLRINNKPVTFESQSGYDGRLLEKDPELAELLKKAKFVNVKIAWDNLLSDKKSIQKQINYLNKQKYPSKEISVFMIYNFNIPYEIMVKKIHFCKKWGVQINDCRYRPLSAIKDDYNPHKFKEGQTKDDYYIHEEGGWTDQKIRKFRQKVRQHNLEIRYTKGQKYDRRMEKWSAIHNTFKFFKLGRPPKMEQIDKSEIMKEEIKILNKLKKNYEKIKISPPDLENIAKKDLKKKIETLLKNLEINS